MLHQVFLLGFTFPTEEKQFPARHFAFPAQESNFLRGISLFPHGKSNFLHGISLFLRRKSNFLHGISLFLRRKSNFLRDISLFPHRKSNFLPGISLFPHGKSNFLRGISLFPHGKSNFLRPHYGCSVDTSLNSTARIPIELGPALMASSSFFSRRHRPARNRRFCICNGGWNGQSGLRTGIELAPDSLEAGLRNPKTRPCT